MSRRDGDGWALGDLSRKTPPTRAAAAYREPDGAIGTMLQGKKRSSIAHVATPQRQNCPAQAVNAQANEKSSYHDSGAAVGRRGATHDVEMHFSCVT